MPGSRSSSNTVRRSVALPRSLVAEVMDVTDRGLRGNLNRLITVALREYVERRRRAEFEVEMARMAADPAIQKECRAVQKSFRVLDARTGRPAPAGSLPPDRMREIDAALRLSLSL